MYVKIRSIDAGNNFRALRAKKAFSLPKILLNIAVSRSNAIFLAQTCARERNDAAARRRQPEGSRKKKRRAENEKNLRQNPRQPGGFAERVERDRGTKKFSAVRTGRWSARRRDVVVVVGDDGGLSDCTVGGSWPSRRPWNFHVNKISGRAGCLSNARGRWRA